MDFLAYGLFISQQAGNNSHINYPASAAPWAGGGFSKDADMGQELTSEQARIERISLENMERPLQFFKSHYEWYAEIGRLKEIERKGAQ